MKPLTNAQRRGGLTCLGALAFSATLKGFSLDSAAEVGTVSLYPGLGFGLGLVAGLLSWAAWTTLRTKSRKRRFQLGRDGGALIESLADKVNVENFAPIKTIFAQLRADGISDLDEHLRLHPTLMAEWRRRISLTAANPAAVKAAGFDSLKAMQASFGVLLTPPFLNVFRAQLISLWTNQKGAQEEIHYLDTQGNPCRCVARWAVAELPPSEPEWSRVLLWMSDSTQQQNLMGAKIDDQRLLRQILARTNLLLWWGTVTRKGDRFKWRIDVPEQLLASPILKLATAVGQGGLWDRAQSPDFVEMNARSDRALSNGESGYQHQFRVISEEKTYWLSEEVGIQRVSENEWGLFGVISDVTAAHEAAELKKRSEVQIKAILERVDCMLWQARVSQREGYFHWNFDVPESGLKRRILENRALVPGRDGEAALSGLYGPFEVQEQREMDMRSSSALRAGLTGYEQEFHLITPKQTFWLQERVAILPLAAGEWSLVGVTFDVTARREAEEARKTSEAQLTQILDRADCLLWQARVTETEGQLNWHFVFLRSDLQRRFFRGEAGLKTSKVFTNLVVPERAELDARSSTAIRGGLPGYEQEFRIIKDEQTVWLREKVSIARVAENQWDLVGVSVDVTERHEAEAARKETEHQLQQILTRADCLIWQARVTKDAEGKIEWDMFIPPSILHQRIFGESVSGKRFFMWEECQVPELLEMHERCLRALRKGDPGYEQEFRAFRDGKKFWLYEQVSIVPEGSDAWTLVGVITDISARRAAEEALAAEKDRLNVTLQAMEEGVITIGTDGVVQFINEAAENMLQGERGKIVGRPFRESCSLLDDTTERELHWDFERVFKRTGVIDLPAQAMIKDRLNRRILVEGCCAPVRDAGGERVAAVFVFRDVTERQRLKSELLRASKLESVGILAGGIAHDFNNILTAILGNLSLAELEADNQSMLKTYLGEAQRASIRARDLTQQLLTFAKGGDPVREAVSLPEIVLEISQFALRGSRVKCDYDLPADLWPANADKGQVSQIVQNLVINAAQAMPDGGIVRIVARNETLGPGTFLPLAQGDYVRISFSDTGVGITAEHLGKVFDPYFTTKKQGSGFGLATVYSILKKHRGHVDVESEPGRGTTFHIWLPALPGQQGGTAATQQKPFGHFQGRVLIMDDDPAVRQMAGQLLERLGFEVKATSDGAEAVEAYKSAQTEGRSFVLVVMDLTVPGGMGGCDALVEIRKLDPAVKAIVSSGYSSDPVMANFQHHGFQGVVAKPYRIEDFIRVLSEVLQR